MEREIKFRAKEANSNNWIFGDLLNCQFCKKIGVLKYLEDNVPIIYKEEPVKESTIGEFTGYRVPYTKDMIFEGDFLSNNHGTEKEVIRKVMVENGCWIMRRVKGNSGLPKDILLAEHYEMNYKIVGNYIDTKL